MEEDVPHTASFSQTMNYGGAAYSLLGAGPALPSYDDLSAAGDRSQHDERVMNDVWRKSRLVQLTGPFAQSQFTRDVADEYAYATSEKLAQCARATLPLEKLQLRSKLRTAALGLVGLSGDPDDARGLLGALRVERSLWRLVGEVFGELRKPQLPGARARARGRTAADLRPPIRASSELLDPKKHKPVLIALRDVAEQLRTTKFGMATPLGDRLDFEQYVDPESGLPMDSELILLQLALNWLHASAYDDADDLVTRAHLAVQVAGSVAHSRGDPDEPSTESKECLGISNELWCLSRSGSALLLGGPAVDGGDIISDYAFARGEPAIAAMLCCGWPAADVMVAHEKIERRGIPNAGAVRELARSEVAKTLAGCTRETASERAAATALTAVLVGGSNIENLRDILDAASDDARVARGPAPGQLVASVFSTWEDAFWVEISAAAAGRVIAPIEEARSLVRSGASAASRSFFSKDTYDHEDDDMSSDSVGLPRESTRSANTVIAAFDRVCDAFPRRDDDKLGRAFLCCVKALFQLCSSFAVVPPKGDEALLEAVDHFFCDLSNAIQALLPESALAALTASRSTSYFDPKDSHNESADALTSSTEQLPPATVPLVRWAAHVVAVVRTHTALSASLRNITESKGVTAGDDLLLLYARHLASEPTHILHAEAVVELVSLCISKERACRMLVALAVALPYDDEERWSAKRRDVAKNESPRRAFFKALWEARGRVPEWDGVCDDALRHAAALFVVSLHPPVRPDSVIVPTPQKSGGFGVRRNAGPSGLSLLAVHGNQLAGTGLPLPQPPPHLPADLRATRLELVDFVRITGLQMLGFDPAYAAASPTPLTGPQLSSTSFAAANALSRAFAAALPECSEEDHEWSKFAASPSASAALLFLYKGFDGVEPFLNPAQVDHFLADASGDVDRGVRDETSLWRAFSEFLHNVNKSHAALLQRLPDAPLKPATETRGALFSAAKLAESSELERSKHRAIYHYNLLQSEFFNAERGVGPLVDRVRESARRLVEALSQLKTESFAGVYKLRVGGGRVIQVATADRISGAENSLHFMERTGGNEHAQLARVLGIVLTSFADVMVMTAEWLMRDALAVHVFRDQKNYCIAAALDPARELGVADVLQGFQRLDSAWHTVWPTGRLAELRERAEHLTGVHHDAWYSEEDMKRLTAN